ncbi:MAG: hypothetical protein SW833_13625 [Cyanobacteriota bacterium]|nr:hypothetical protein [Cyanobacteriota bacterium]
MKPEPPTSLKFQLQPGATLVLQLSFFNEMNEAVLLRPTLEDWVVASSDRVLSASQNLDPPYIYLFSGSKASQTMEIAIPAEVSPGQMLKAGLRFPGIQENAIALDLEIVPVAQPLPQILEFPLSVTFPIFGETNPSSWHIFDGTTAGSAGLISGIIDLDRIPTRWLAAELLIIIAQRGEEYAGTVAGSTLLEQLKTTAFFQNGAIALGQAQLPQWLSESLTIANTLLASTSQPPGQNRLLYLWERWLLSLADTDVEANEIGNPIGVPPFLAEAAVAQLGGDTDRWWETLLLGLAVLSPPIARGLEEIARANSPTTAADAKAAEAGYRLATALPGLNFLPVRWLVVELLVVLAQIGNEFAQSDRGRQLAHNLGRTRFFKNGVGALSAAKVPRWLQISQSAATAFATAIGEANATGGMLAFWEQWLWSLLPANSPFPPSTLTPSAGETLSAELGMNSDRWFEAIVLGLATLSPRIAAILEAIAALAPPLPTRPSPPQIPGEDIISESPSLRR